MGPQIAGQDQTPFEDAGNPFVDLGPVPSRFDSPR